MKYFIIMSLLAPLALKAQVKPHQPSAAAQAYFQDAQTRYARGVGNKDSMAVVFRLLNKSLKADSLFYNAYASKMAYQCQLEEYNAACLTARKMASLFPEDIYVALLCGALQYKTGHKAEGIVYCNKVVKICDAVPEKNRKGDAYHNLLTFKGIALLLMDKSANGRPILQSLYSDEQTPVVKSRLAQYLNAVDKNALIEAVLPGRWN